MSVEQAIRQFTSMSTNPSLYECVENYRTQNKCPICTRHLNDTCKICLVTKNDVICATTTNVCGCTYHQHCINAWLSEKPTCPVCEKRWVRVCRN